ncbi:MAG: ParB/RepB/Spo0J family partition protein [Oscillospiraceae bacterium]|jgi:ParB family chromosome partitioning protein|nr:ParB/RepB/Spo0J family partition protein [Oscillospiraceae bacterium]
MAAKGTEKGLGTGLGALFGDAAVALPNDFAYIPIAKIEPNRSQPRARFDEAALDELTDSIREHGVLQPLTVRSLGDGYYQIIAGERRWRAARQAGVKELPARIIAADDRKTAEISLVENLQREDLNPIEEALGYRALVSEYGMTQDEAARRVGKSRPAVANALRLLSLPEDILALVENGELNTGAARALLPLKDGELIRDAARAVIDRELNVRETERLVKRLAREVSEPVPEPETGESGGITVNYIERIASELTEKLGRRVKITQGKNKGRVEIEYYDQDDFERLYAAIASLAGKRRGNGVDTDD